MRCDGCAFEARSAQGLAAHRRAKHSQADGGANARAMESTLTELERLGRVESIDAARVQALRTMATALDENPYNSQMWREYREALGEVLKADDDADDGLAAALAQIRGAAEMGDPPAS